MKKYFSSLFVNFFKNKNLFNTSCRNHHIQFKGMNIIIEGNIGSGKSTTLNYLKQKYNEKINVFCEPIEKWRNVNNVNLFDLMYKDPKRWGFAFQSYVQLTMIEQHLLLNKLSSQQNQINFSERSIISARYIFVENLYRKNFLTDLEYGILDDYFKFFATQEKIKIDLIIYLKSDPELCQHRVKLRSRPEEDCLSLDSFKFFHELHEEIFGDTSKIASKIWDIPFLEVDAQSPVENRFELIDNFLKDNFSHKKLELSRESI